MQYYIKMDVKQWRKNRSVYGRIPQNSPTGKSTTEKDIFKM